MTLLSASMALALRRDQRVPDRPRLGCLPGGLDLIELALRGNSEEACEVPFMKGLPEAHQ